MKKTLLLVLFIIPAVSFGQEYPKKSYTAHRTENPPVINGDPFDSVWENGSWEGGFFQYEPDEASPVRQKTEFNILYDNDNLYVAFRAWDTAPDSIVSRMTRRDHGDGDQVYIYIDSYHDLRTAFGFGVSAAGVKTDLVMADNGSSEDETWDPVWYAKTGIFDWGWAAEMRIPLSQLRFSSASDQVWGMEVIRNIYRYDETDFWQPVARNAPGLVHLAGLLDGISGIKPANTLDITPYSVVKAETYAGTQGNPWLDGSDLKANAGLDARIGVTNNLTMNLTINPDFGQVEADPSEVNLSAFETFFDEKRPFFVEGKNITDFNLGIGDGDTGSDNIFYSRRIGKSPKNPYRGTGNEEVFTPAFIPILGAAKLTGKSAGGFSVGVIEAVTARVNTKVYDPDTDETRFVTAEPLASYSVGRIQKDFNGGKTIIGGIITGTFRSLDDQTSDFFHKAALTGGVDYTRYFGNMNYIFRIRTAFSNVTGSENAIARTQRSTIHNFIRPDAGYVDYDPSRTSLSGTGGNLFAGKIGGNFQILYLSYWKSPGLELNDIGYLQVADRYLGAAVINYSIHKPFSIFNRMTFSTNLIHLNDFSAKTLMVAQSFSWSSQFKNLWYANIVGQVNSRERDNLILRGGPSMMMPGSAYLSGYASSSERRKIVVEASSSVSWTYLNVSRSWDAEIELTYRPSGTLEISAEPEWSNTVNTMQYVQTLPVSATLLTPRYIFGRIEQKILSLSLRIDYNITPDLTVQYWGQPFFGSGKYSAFRRITDTEATLFTHRFHVFNDNEISAEEPGASYDIDEDLDGITDYSFRNPDFTVSEFLSNLVVRWEFLPGSSVYLVWSQSRDYTTGNGIFSLDRQIDEIFSGYKPDNIFLLKLSYRFGLR